MLAILLNAAVSWAQPDLPRNGVGLHLGITNGLDFRRQLGNGDALEFIFSSQWSGYLLTLMYQDQHDITDQMSVKNRTYVFYGGGLHYGNFNSESPLHPGPSIGLDLDMGVEQYFRSIPFSLGIEFRVIGDAQLENWNLRLLGDLALNFRYVF